MRRWLWLVLLLPLQLAAHVTEFEDHAHQPGVTYTAIGLAAGQVNLLYTVPGADLAELAGTRDLDEAAEVVRQGFVLENAGESCPASIEQAVDYDAISAWQFELSFRCDEPLDFLRFYYELFEDDPTHRNYTEVILGTHVLQLALGGDVDYVDVPVAHLEWERGPSWALPVELPAFRGRKPSLGEYFVAGFDHVLSGYDHLAFVLGLVLVLASFAQLAWAITAFTLAHTVTVGISAASVWVPPPGLIEPLIAASIVYIGAENLFYLWQRQKHVATGMRQAFARRWPVAFIFGLAHGFGFSYMLREMGLPPGEFLITLALFNIGVEAGQLAVVALPFLAIYAMRRREPVYYGVAASGSIAVSAVGAYWLLERLGWIA